MAARNGNRQSVTEAEWKQFLELIRDGKQRPAAAAELGRTGSQFRSLCARDPKRKSAYEAAVEAGRSPFREDLRQEWHERAKKSDRLFWYECVSNLPECSWARRGNSTEPLAETASEIDFSQLSDEELDQLCETLARAIGERGALDVPGS